MPVTTDELIDKASGAKAASIVLAQASTDLKNRALAAIARAIRAREGEILAANAQDCSNASPRIEIDRLRLTPQRIAGMARDVEAVAGLARSDWGAVRPDHAPQWTRHIEAARASGRRRRRVRVAAQRDERRRGDLPEDRQCSGPSRGQRSAVEQPGDCGGHSRRFERGWASRDVGANDHVDRSRARAADAEAA